MLTKRKPRRSERRRGMSSIEDRARVAARAVLETGRGGCGTCGGEASECPQIVDEATGPVAAFARAEVVRALERAKRGYVEGSYWATQMDAMIQEYRDE